MCGLYGFLTTIFGPILNNLGPLWFVIFIASSITLITLLITKFTVDQNLIKKLKDDIKKLNSQPEKMPKQIMDKQMVVIKNSIKPMFITIIPVVIIFGWMSANIAEINLFGWGTSWLFVYIIFSIISNMLLRKILKVY